MEFVVQVCEFCRCKVSIGRWDEGMVKVFEVHGMKSFANMMILLVDCVFIHHRMLAVHILIKFLVTVAPVCAVCIRVVLGVSSEMV